MFQSIRGFYSALGVMLFLVALYLVLNQASGATSIIGSAASAGRTIFTTLQGRS
jgi:hypothetical protein